MNKSESNTPWTTAQGYAKNSDALRATASHRTRLRAADEQVKLLEQTVTDFEDKSVSEVHHLPNFLHHQARMAAGQPKGWVVSSADTTELGSIEAALDGLRV